MARLPYADPEQASPQVRRALERLPPLNIFRMLAQADSAFIPFLGFGGALLSELELDPFLRELAILLVAVRTEADYEWIQHADIARALGMSEQQLEAVRCGELEAECLSRPARAVLRFVHESLAGPRVAEQTLSDLGEHLPPRQVVELLLVMGNYQMLARVMTVLDLDIDAAMGRAVVDGAERRPPRKP